MKSRFFGFGAFLLAAVLPACGGGGGGAGVQLMPIGLSTQSMSFLSLASAPQTVTASEAGYSGAFSATTTTCAGIASIALQSGTTFVVTPISAGSCSFSIADTLGQK